METKPLKEETTKIIWALNGEISYPWNIILLFNDVSAEIGDDLEKGLENLKPILEKR